VTVTAVAAPTVKELVSMVATLRAEILMLKNEILKGVALVSWIKE
jgi:hypothetical protein